MEQPDELKVKYHAGYLIPAEPLSGQFDIQVDSALIASGSHFFCHVCLQAVAIEEQSPDPNYCVNCFKSLKEIK